MTGYPAEVMAAVAEAIHRADCEWDLADCIAEHTHDRAAKEVLEAAAPLITAAEREQIRQLAIERDATAWSHDLDHNECSRVPFADLMGGAE